MRKASVALILYITLLWPPAVLSANDIDVVRTTVYAWSNAWRNRDIDTYMSFYSPSFRSNKLDYQKWRVKKVKQFQSVRAISLEISDLWVFIEGERASATFVQRYQASTFTDVGEKTLILVKMNDTWKIVSEEWKPLTCTFPEIPSTQNTIQSLSLDSSYENRSEDINDSSNKELIVKNIRFEIGKDWEKVFVDLNDFAVPVVFGLEGSNPRIIIDIKDVSAWNGPKTIPVNGRLIKQIRSCLHRDSEKLRIVLDLMVAEDYIITQTYYKAANIFCLQVR